MKALLALFLLALAPSPAPTPSPMPTGLIYAGHPAAHFNVVARPLGFDPDGNARWLLVAKYTDANGAPTRIMANGNVDWKASRGYVQWQTRMRYGSPSAIVKTVAGGPLLASAASTIPSLGTVEVRTDPQHWAGPRVVAQALGPHVVQIGWFPQERKLARIVRVDAAGNGRTIGIIAGPSSSYRDVHVQPNHRYRYIVYRADAPAVKLSAVRTPQAPPSTAIANAGGKAMWLFFSTNPLDANYYGKLHPQEIIDRAVASGLHYVELRTAYGAYWEITPAARPTMDAIIDGLAAHGIGTIGWSVPRDTTFEDVQASTRTAYYRTAKGTPLTGLAVDVERGDEFMGGDPNGLNALWQYMRSLREAMGPHYLLVATVEDAYLEHLDNTKYPFKQIARYSDVLQPMAYWRMMRRKPTDPAQVRVLLKASYDKLLREAGRTLPVSVGGQTTAEGRNGYPPAEEITASLDAAKGFGAIGECFFDWDGTQPYQWSALSNYTW
ncbi:MAG: hypothetical protein M3R35_05745 [Candidatus Eremiobacteraeota bacterium]|nr:hypothetical protein [Candidatus Eremiobacteraeota bacterium]